MSFDFKVRLLILSTVFNIDSISTISNASDGLTKGKPYRNRNRLTSQLFEPSIVCGEDVIQSNP